MEDEGKKTKTKADATEHKERSAQRDAPHRENYKAYMATVEDIQNFLMDCALPTLAAISSYADQPRRFRVVCMPWLSTDRPSEV